MYQTETELEDLPYRKEENLELLESFDTPEPEHYKERQTDEYDNEAEGEDNRLLFSTEDETRGSGASEIDRNIHSAIEGTSSGHYDNQGASSSSMSATAGQSSSMPGLSSFSENTDLESQGNPNRRLSPRERILNVMHALFPVRQTYDRINNGLTTGRMQANLPGNFIGQGTDGVFRNLMAKPDTESNRLELETHPPSYDEAAADATPEYWESTVISPMYEDEVFVEGLPVGNVANFVWNGLVSVAFQFVGFILCYLLHTSHAAKQGSRAGLGITFIMYGLSMIPSNSGHANSIPNRYEPEDPNGYEVNKGTSVSKGSKIDDYNAGIFQQHAEELSELFESKTPYFAYGVIAFGLFMILKALVDFWKVTQIERVILAPPGGASSLSPFLWETSTDAPANEESSESESGGHRLHDDEDLEEEEVEQEQVRA